MIRLAVLLLAGATFVAAQTAPVTTDVDQMAEQLKTKLHEAYQKAGEDADKAHAAAVEFQNQMRTRSGEDAEKVMEQRRAEANVRLQGAIDALERASEKVGTQVEDVRERIQSRIAEKRQKLMDLQKKILERQAARKAEGAEKPEVDAEKPAIEKPEITKPTGEKPEGTRPTIDGPKVKPETTEAPVVPATTE